MTDRIRSCRAVLWAITTYGGRLVEILGESFGSLLEEGQAMPFEVQLALFKRKLTMLCDRLVSTDRAYRDQKAVETLVRVRRDLAVDEVNKDVVGLRQAFTGIYSDEKLAEFGFARRTPQLPRELVEQTSHLVIRLDSPDLDLSGSLFDDYKLDAPHMARRGLAKFARGLAAPELEGAVEAAGRQVADLVADPQLYRGVGIQAER